MIRQNLPEKQTITHGIVHTKSIFDHESGSMSSDFEEANDQWSDNSLK